MGENYGALSCEQQGKLMSRINELALIDDKDSAEEAEESIREFIDYLVWYGFITPQARTRYFGGIRDSMEIGRRRRAARC